MTMDCAEARKHLQEYVDGEPSPEGLCAHLEACEDCRCQARFQGLLKRCVKAGCEGMPSECRQRILARLHREAGRPPLVRWGLVAAALLLLTLVPFWLFQGPPAEASTLVLEHQHCWKAPCGGQATERARQFLAEHPDLKSALPEAKDCRDMRLCVSPEGVPTLHVMYEVPRAGGAPWAVSLYAWPCQGRKPWGSFECDGSRGLGWSKDGWLFTLVSDAPPDVLESLARL